MQVANAFNTSFTQI